MSKTYKAVFECEETGERVVWWVGSRTEAKRQMRHHTHTTKNKLRKEYRGKRLTLTVKPVFEGNDDVGYDSTIMGWGGN